MRGSYRIGLSSAHIVGLQARRRVELFGLAVGSIQADKGRFAQRQALSAVVRAQAVEIRGAGARRRVEITCHGI